jgi:hypothetical protein
MRCATDSNGACAGAATVCPADLAGGRIAMGLSAKAHSQSSNLPGPATAWGFLLVKVNCLPPRGPDRTDSATVKLWTSPAASCAGLFSSGTLSADAGETHLRTFVAVCQQPNHCRGMVVIAASTSASFLLTGERTLAPATHLSLFPVGRRGLMVAENRGATCET